MATTVTSPPAHAAVEVMHLACGCWLRVDSAGTLEVDPCAACDRAALERLSSSWRALGSPAGVITLERRTDAG
jgi:hypothetical protein